MDYYDGGGSGNDFNLVSIGGVGSIWGREGDTPHNIGRGLA